MKSLKVKTDETSRSIANNNQTDKKVQCILSVQQVLSSGEGAFLTLTH